MKIYFADSIQREQLSYNKKFKIENMLESYFAIVTKKEFDILRKLRSE